MVVVIEGLLSKESQVDKEDLSVHKAGIMKENFLKSKLKEKASLLLKILDIDTKDNGKDSFPMEEENKLGSNLDFWLLIEDSMFQVKNMAMESTKMAKNGLMKETFQIMN